MQSRQSWNLLHWLPPITAQILIGYIVVVYTFSTASCQNENSYCVLHLMVTSVLLMLFEISAMRSILATYPKVPDKYRLSSTEQLRLLSDEESLATQAIENELAAKLSIFTRDARGHIRFCGQCEIVCPDRCYHCHTCDTCVLRLDHHCGWFNTCVHFGNHKFFMLTVWYGMWTAISMLVPSIVRMSNIDESDDASGRVTFVLVPILLVLFGLFAVLNFFFLNGLLKNLTSLEHKLGIYNPVGEKIESLYDVGWKRNFEQIFGESKLLWLLPIYTTQGDGITFKIRNDKTMFLS